MGPIGVIIMGNQMENKMENEIENEMETAIWDYRVDVGVILEIRFFRFHDSPKG